MESIMNEHKQQIFQKSWGFMDQELSIEEEASNSSSVSSCSSFDTADDASSLTSSSSSSLNSINESSALDLSDLMIQLPIKRGLSKFYQGKSESFTSLARVMSIEDLPKKVKNPYNKMMKMKSKSKSYGGGLDNYKSYTLPKPVISKKLSPISRQRGWVNAGQQNYN